MVAQIRLAHLLVRLLEVSHLLSHNRAIELIHLTGEEPASGALCLGGMPVADLHVKLGFAPITIALNPRVEQDGVEG